MSRQGNELIVILRKHAGFPARFMRGNLVTRDLTKISGRISGESRINLDLHLHSPYFAYHHLYASTPISPYPHFPQQSLDNVSPYRLATTWTPPYRSRVSAQAVGAPSL